MGDLGEPQMPCGWPGSHTLVTNPGVWGVRLNPNEHDLFSFPLGRAPC